MSVFKHSKSAVRKEGLPRLRNVGDIDIGESVCEREDREREAEGVEV